MMLPRPVLYASEVGKCQLGTGFVQSQLWLVLSGEKLTSLNLTTPLLSSCLTLVGVLGVSASSAPWKTMGGACQPVPARAADAPACSPAASVRLPSGLKVPAQTSCLLLWSYCSTNVFLSGLVSSISPVCCSCQDLVTERAAGVKLCSPCNKSLHESSNTPLGLVSLCRLCKDCMHKQGKLMSIRRSISIQCKAGKLSTTVRWNP